MPPDIRSLICRHLSRDLLGPLNVRDDLVADLDVWVKLLPGLDRVIICLLFRLTPSDVTLEP